MSSTEFVLETKHRKWYTLSGAIDSDPFFSFGTSVFHEGDDSQIKRRIIRYRKLGERVNGIILGFDKVILLFPDMMTKPRMEDVSGPPSKLYLTNAAAFC
jgi:hypothetical protein